MMKDEIKKACEVLQKGGSDSLPDGYRVGE